MNNLQKVTQWAVFIAKSDHIIDNLYKISRKQGVIGRILLNDDAYLGKQWPILSFFPFPLGFFYLMCRQIITANLLRLIYRLRLDSTGKQYLQIKLLVFQLGAEWASS